MAKEGLMRILVVGNVNVDVLMGNLAPWPKRGSEVLVDTYQLRVGGALGNTALALNALGVEAAYHANVGSDALGSWLYDELAEHGCYLTRSPGPTALTVGLTHPDGERTFITHEGHFKAFDVAPLRRAVQSLSPNDMLLLSGYFLVPSLRAAALELCRTVREKGGRILLDTGWPSEGWTRAVQTEVATLLQFCDIFLPNQEELSGLTACDDVPSGLESVSTSSGVRTVVKLGGKGAGFLEEHRYVVVPAPTVTVVDTVGAGDTFNAGFIYALRNDAPLHEATRAAVRAASATVSTLPRRYATPSELVDGKLTA